VLVVTHGGVLHAVHHAALGFSPQGIGYRVHNGSITVIKVEKGTAQEQQQQQVQEQQQILGGATWTVTAEPAAVTAAEAEAPLKETSAAAAAVFSGRAAMEPTTTATLLQPLSPAVTAVEATASAAEGVSPLVGQENSCVPVGTLMLQVLLAVVAAGAVVVVSMVMIVVLVAAVLL
jgi:hypothetical protein